MSESMEIDDALAADLHSIAKRADPPPPGLRAAARGAYTWRTADEELAELVFDSAGDEHALAGVRAGAGPRLLTFAGAGLEVEVEVTGTEDRRRLVGQVVPPQPARIEVRHEDGSVPVDADALGRFAAADIAPGPVSLRCVLGTGAEARAVVTDWLPL